MLSSETCCWKAGTAASVGDRAESGQDTEEASSAPLGLGVGSLCSGVLVASTL